MGDVLHFPKAKLVTAAADFRKTEANKDQPALLAFRADVFLLNGSIGFSLIHPRGPKVGRATAAMMLRRAADKLDEFSQDQP
jgi:hypothetical protein